MLFDNTTIQGSWVEVQNMSALSSQYGRTVQNISMALPHAAVAAAGRDQENGILQPQDLGVSTEFSYPFGGSQLIQVARRHRRIYY